MNETDSSDNNGSSTANERDVNDVVAGDEVVDGATLEDAPAGDGAALAEDGDTGDGDTSDLADSDEPDGAANDDVTDVTNGDAGFATDAVAPADSDDDGDTDGDADIVDEAADDFAADDDPADENDDGDDDTVDDEDDDEVEEEDEGEGKSGLKPIAVALGGRIRQARQDAGLSQVRLATLLTTTQSAISLYEAGQRIISIEMLLRTASILNRPLHFFLSALDSVLYVRDSKIASLVAELELRPQDIDEIMEFWEFIRWRSEVKDAKASESTDLATES